MSDLIDKIGALLLKAERTDNDHERDALQAKAAELAALASIDLSAALMRQTHKEKRETPITKHIDLFSVTDRSKTKAYFVLLFTVIGETQDVQFLIDLKSNFVIAHGYPSDIDVTEALYGSLAQQMVRDAEAWLATGAYKTEARFDPWTRTVKPVHGATARRSFYEGFRVKVAQRLRAAKQETLEQLPDVDTDNGKMSAELVVTKKAETVRAYFKQETSHIRAMYRGGRGDRSTAASLAGTEAGERASLGANAEIDNTKQAISA